MVYKKGRKKLMFKGQSFYWYIKKDDVGYPTIIVYSEDKRLRLNTPLIDSEAIGGPMDAVELLKAQLLHKE